jgi:hypothetical protein
MFHGSLVLGAQLLVFAIILAIVRADVVVIVVVFIWRHVGDWFLETIGSARKGFRRIECLEIVGVVRTAIGPDISSFSDVLYQQG